MLQEQAFLQFSVSVEVRQENNSYSFWDTLTSASQDLHHQKREFHSSVEIHCERVLAEASLESWHKSHQINAEFLWHSLLGTTGSLCLPVCPQHLIP